MCAIAASFPGSRSIAVRKSAYSARVTGYFAQLARHLIIEFVPKQDSQVVKLLATREDVFPSYDEAGFEQALGAHFTGERKAPIPGTVRTLYLARRKD